MKMFNAILLGCTMAALVTGTAFAADERMIFGWGGSGGGNLTMFSKNHDNPVARAGELSFIYGGGPTVEGDVKFLRYDGTNWNEMMSLDQAGVFRIGAATTQACGGCKLAVNGSIVSTEVRVASVANWPDFVFKEDYKLQSLDDVEAFIETNGHLPGLPSASKVNETGISLGEMNAMLLQKVEELTLYMIEMKRENKAMRQQLSELTQKN